MTSIAVSTQQEFDAAFERDDLSEIRVVAGEWITVRASGSATVRAYDSATVHAYDSATVHASGSATVRAYDSVTVHASGSVTVCAYSSATVYASGSVTVCAYSSATVYASGSATVRAYESVTVHAYDSATIHAGPYVAVQKLDSRTSITGGVVIDHTNAVTDSPESWAKYRGAEVEGEHVILFKATDKDLTAGQDWNSPTVYAVGSVVTALDFLATKRCGNGLHLSQSPGHASAYRDEDEKGQRYLKVRAKLSQVIVLDRDKVKVPSCEVLSEVDLMGREI